MFHSSVSLSSGTNVSPKLLGLIYKLLHPIDLLEGNPNQAPGPVQGDPVPFTQVIVSF